MKQRIPKEKEVLASDKEVEMLCEEIYQLLISFVVKHRMLFKFSINYASVILAIGAKEIRNYERLDCNIGLKQWCKILATYLLYLHHNHIESDHKLMKTFMEYLSL